MKFLKVCGSILLYIWQLPQNIAGFIISRFSINKETYKDVTVYYMKRKKNYWGVSLGKYIILADRFPNLDRTIRHEYGHCRQSRYLGWLYLIVVGIPSGCLNLLSRVNKTIHSKYYTLYPEKWAEKLGGNI